MLDDAPWGTWTDSKTGHVLEFDLERPAQDGTNLGRLPLLRTAPPLEFLTQGRASVTAVPVLPTSVVPASDVSVASPPVVLRSTSSGEIVSPSVASICG